MTTAARVTPAAPATVPRDIVVLSTADWDNPFWTNKQHVACQLADRGFRVLYIDSLGLRRPSARAQDFARIRQRLRRAFDRPRFVRDRLWVWSPVMLPFHASGAVRTLNRRLLSFSLGGQLKRLGFTRPLLWTYNPLTARLLDPDAFDSIVYHCVDDISAQPGMPAHVLATAEEELARNAAIIFATSPRLCETRRRWNRNTHFLPNVADYDHFSRALEPGLALPADLADVPGPRVGFIGALSSYKVDFELLRTAARARPALSFVLVGKVGEGDPWTDSSSLDGLDNLHVLGARPYAELPAYLKGFDVALLPNRINEYTASMFPMKFFEYLAAGRPVVATDLPAIRQYDGIVHLAPSVESFLAGIDAAVDGRAAPLENRLAAAMANTWDARMDRMLELLADMDARSRQRREGKAA
jgi:glycosyltransferase involved in cell wall biosynthesis